MKYKKGELWNILRDVIVTSKFEYFLLTIYDLINQIFWMVSIDLSLEKKYAVQQYNCQNKTFGWIVRLGKLNKL